MSAVAATVVFRGGPELVLDVKGRLTVPTRWRDQLMDSVQGRLVITKTVEGGLALYPANVWQTIEATVLALPAENDAWRRFVLGNASDVDIDSGSRVLIPPELRAWAGMEKDVKFMGMGAHFELWDKTRHDAREALTLAQGRPEVLRNLVVR
jgi:MraZ protein